MTTDDIIYSLLVGLVSFAAGFLGGQATAWKRETHNGKKVLVPAITSNVTRKRFFGAFLVLMAIGTLLQGTYYNYTQAQCNDQFQAAIISRSVIQRDDNANVVQLFKDQARDITEDAPLTDIERLEYISKFEERAALNEQERLDNPYPPDGGC